MFEETMNIRLATVGGQGGILASSIIAKVSFEHGLDVKKREVHGMSQRGGVVTSDVRFGNKVYSPMVPRGAIDYLLAFEQAEALRAIPDLKKTGTVIINTQVIVPPIVAIGKASYVEDALTEVRDRAKQVHTLDALSLATAAGSPKTVSTVMLGALSTYLPFENDAWISAIKTSVPGKTIDSNMKAFQSGRETVKTG